MSLLTSMQLIKMARPCVWATQVELQAAADCYARDIYTLTKTPDKKWLSLDIIATSHKTTDSKRQAILNLLIFLRASGKHGKRERERKRKRKRSSDLKVSIVRVDGNSMQVCW